MKRYLDRQKYSECQLVAAINAAVHMGQPPINPRSAEYERLVDFVGARHGSAISIHRALGYLRIWEQKSPISLRVVRQALAAGNPVGIDVHHEKAGSHSVLIVGVRGRGRNTSVRVPNFRQATKKQWMRWSDISAMTEDASGEFGCSGGWCKGKWIYIFRKRK